MGHLHQLKSEYKALLRRFEAGPVSMPEPSSPAAREGWKDILEILYSPEEAELVSRFPVAPSTLGELSSRMGMPGSELEPRLDRMCDKGIVLDFVNPRTGEVRYLISPPVIGFFEFSMMRIDDGIPKKRMAEALEAYTHGDDTFYREVFGTETVLSRALVHETALGELPEVLDWERATSIIQEARALSLGNCYCRHKAHHLGTACDTPQEICLSMNGGAEFVVRRKFGRAIERSEAMDILIASRESGLVQLADNVQSSPTFICNCCGCCCDQLKAINLVGLPAVNPSSFQAHPESNRCIGCSRCARACPISAITMAPHRVDSLPHNTLRPVVDEQRCIGCGVCATTCRKKAINMTRRPARPNVPLNAIERAVRMALERGRMADLIFMAADGPGIKFLGIVLRALTGLPGINKIIAGEQVRSRFVRAMLSRVQNPLEG